MVSASVIGKRLTKLRGERTQDKVAEDNGISRSAISMYESGERIPRDEIKCKLASYYNSTIEAIFYAE